MSAVSYRSLPFAEAIAFFRRKLNVNTERYTDVWGEAHDFSFMVAGANRDDLVAEFRAAIDKAIADGATLADFRRDFDAIVEKFGWSYNGGRNWRSRVIFETNLRTAYAAGRWSQLQEGKKWRPYWQYVHSDAVQHPRPQHLAWDGLVLSADDPWWHAHFPPNGWGCQCTIQSLANRDLKRLGKSGPDTAPDDGTETVTVGKRGPSPFDVETPVGVDPGFGYAPGRRAFDTWLHSQALAASRATDSGWQALTNTTAAALGRPAHIPLAPAPVPLGPLLNTAQAIVDALTDMIGGATRLYDVHGLPVAIDAQVLGAHIAKDVGRSRYLPLLPDLLADPWEVWQTLERHVETGALRVRARIIKGYDLGNGQALLFVVNQQGGVFTSWTLVPTSNLKYADRQRLGVLLYGAD